MTWSCGWSTEQPLTPVVHGNQAAASQEPLLPQYSNLYNIIEQFMRACLSGNNINPGSLTDVTVYVRVASAKVHLVLNNNPLSARMHLQSPV